MQSATAIESRIGADEYWKIVMKDQPMPEAIHGLVHSHSDHSKHKTNKCNENVKSNYAQDFKPIPDATAYNNDVGPQEDHKPFAEDFKPKPDVTGYNEWAQYNVYFYNDWFFAVY